MRTVLTGNGEQSRSDAAVDSSSKHRQQSTCPRSGDDRGTDPPPAPLDEQASPNQRATTKVAQPDASLCAFLWLILGGNATQRWDRRGVDP